MPKSTKRFTISDNRLNTHGFRMLTEGADLSDFIANPIMYWMHIYPTGEQRDELLPIGFWEDIEIGDGKITAIPNFDDSDDFAMTIYKKVEHGTLRACSAGAEPKPGGLSSDPADMLPNQRFPTFKQWWLREASICDRGSNTGAVALKVNGKMVQLADNAAEVINSLLQNQKLDMKLTQLTAGGLTAMLSALKLNADTATEEEVTAKVSQLVTLSGTQATQIHTLTAEKSEIEAKLSASEEKYNQQVTLNNTGKIEKLVNDAETSRKITADEKPGLIGLANSHKDGFDAGYKAVEDLISKRPASASAESILNADSKVDENEVQKLAKLSYDELFTSGGLVKLKALSPDSWEKKMNEKFPNRTNKA